MYTHTKNDSSGVNIRQLRPKALAQSLPLESYHFLRAAHVIVEHRQQPWRCRWSCRTQRPKSSTLQGTSQQLLPREALPHATSAHFHLPRGETQTLKCQPLAQPGTPGIRTWHTEKRGGKRCQSITGYCLSTNTAQLSH